MSTTAAITKKKRKSSAEKFLEDNSEYYGFQVLPSKLRSSSVGDAATASITSTTNSTTTATSSFPNPFLDFLHRSNSTSTSGSQVIAGGHHGYGGHAGGHGSAFACATSPASSSSTSSSDNSIQPQHPQPPSQIFAQNKQQQVRLRVCRKNTVKTTLHKTKSKCSRAPPVSNCVVKNVKVRLLQVLHSQNSNPLFCFHDFFVCLSLSQSVLNIFGIFVAHSKYFIKSAHKHKI